MKKENKKEKLYTKEPTHIWLYLQRMGVSKAGLRTIKAELLNWGITEAHTIKSNRLMTVLADLLWDRGWRKKRVTEFLHDFSDRAGTAFSMTDPKPWAEYYKKVAEKTGWIFQEVGDDMVKMIETDFDSEEWEIDENETEGKE